MAASTLSTSRWIWASFMERQAWATHLKRRTRVPWTVLLIMILGGTGSRSNAPALIPKKLLDCGIGLSGVVTTISRLAPNNLSADSTLSLKSHRCVPLAHAPTQTARNALRHGRRPPPLTAWKIAVGGKGSTQSALNASSEFETSKKWPCELEKKIHQGISSFGSKRLNSLLMFSTSLPFLNFNQLHQDFLVDFIFLETLQSIYI